MFNFPVIHQSNIVLEISQEDTAYWHIKVYDCTIEISMGQLLLRLTHGYNKGVE